MPSEEKTAYRVICPWHRGVYLTEEEYKNQLMQYDELWKCPICGDIAEWDDDNFEEFFREDDDEPEES